MSDIIQKKVKLTNVMHNEDIPYASGNGSYKGTLFSYFDQGKTRDVATASKFLESNLALKTELDALEIGQEYLLTVEKKVDKDGKAHWNTTSIVPFTGQEIAPPTQNTRSASNGSKASYVDNSIGMQVGNALNVAGALEAAARTSTGVDRGVKGLEETTFSILKLGEKLKLMLANGDFGPVKKIKVAAPVATPATPKVVDEEIPWGD